jgi:hypothetical protein
MCEILVHCSSLFPLLISPKLPSPLVVREMHALKRISSSQKSESRRGSSSGRGSQLSYGERLLNELIADQREYPLKAEEFRKFLKTLLSDENFTFLQELQELKNSEQKTTDVSTVVVVDTKVKQEQVKNLMEKYIFSGAELELNISGPLRESAVAYYKKVSSEAGAEIDLNTLFGPSEAEIRKLILSQKFVLRFEETMLQNLSDDMIRQRKLQLLALSFVTILIMALTLIFNGSRWYRILTLISNQGAGFAFISAFGRVCPMCAWDGIRHDKKDPTTSVGKQLKDKLFREYVQLKVNRRLRLSMFICTLITAALVAIPESIF